MKLKFIKTFTWNLYNFSFLLCYIQSVWTIIPKYQQQQPIKRNNTFFHERYKHSQLTSPIIIQSTTISPSLQHKLKTDGNSKIHEALHAFNPSNNLHLRHSQNNKHHQYYDGPPSTTISPPKSNHHHNQHRISHQNIGRWHNKQHPSSTSSKVTYPNRNQSVNHHVHVKNNQSNINDGIGAVYNINNHYRTTRLYNHSTARYSTVSPYSNLLSTTTTTPSMLQEHIRRNSLVKNDNEQYFRKITRVEKHQQQHHHYNHHPQQQLYKQHSSGLIPSPLTLITTTTSIPTLTKNSAKAFPIRRWHSNAMPSSTTKVPSLSILNANSRTNRKSTITSKDEYYDFNEKLDENDMLTNIERYIKENSKKSHNFLVKNEDDDDDIIEENDDDEHDDDSVDREIDGKVLDEHKNSWQRFGSKNGIAFDGDTVDEDTDDEDDYDDYLDDESINDDQIESSIGGSFTEEKWRNYGTHEAIQKSRGIRKISPQQMAAHNATEHIFRIKDQMLCKYPRPKIIPISVEPSKTYSPHCTVLHRCGDDIGCCHEPYTSCVPKRTVTVDLYFYVLTLGQHHSTIESLSFINHTECHCVRRNILHPTHRISNVGRSFYSSRSNTPNPVQMNATNCNCVKYFVEVADTISAMFNDDDKTNEDVNRKRCRCDCKADNAICEEYKRGREGFSIEDRRCIAEGRCVMPTCEYGSFSVPNGRCPKLEDKFAAAT